MNCSSPKTKALLVRLHSLGDLVLAAPAAAALADAGSVAVLTNRVYVPLVERFAGNPRPMACDGGPRHLKRCASDLGKPRVLDLQNNLATRLAFPRARRFRFSRRLRRRILALGISAGSMPLRSKAFLEVTGLSGDPVPHLERRGEPAPDRFTVGISVGARWPLKRIPAGVVGELVRLYHELDRARIVLLGEGSDAAEAERIIAACPGMPVRNLCGEGDVALLLSRLERLNLLVAPDSGPAHAACALGVPTLVVFTSTAPELGFWKPDAPNLHMVEGVPCRPCHRHGGKRCPMETEACGRRLVPRAMHDHSRNLL